MMMLLGMRVGVRMSQLSVVRARGLGLHNGVSVPRWPGLVRPSHPFITVRCGLVCEGVRDVAGRDGGRMGARRVGEAIRRLDASLVGEGEGRIERPLASGRRKA